MMLPKLVREFRFTTPEEKEDFLLECCIQLASNKMKDNKSIAKIVSNAKAKMSSNLSRLRGKLVNSKEELEAFELNKTESVCRIASKFMEDMKKDMKKGEEYRFRDIVIPGKVNSKIGEYLEMKEKDGILLIQVFQ